MLAEEGTIGLDDPVIRYLPDLPSADQVTLRMLANNTSGYADYVYTPELLASTNLTPYRQFATDELIDIGTAEPMMFESGTNWGYSHTNFSILGKVMETATGRPLAELMTQYIIEPMGLTSTASTLTPERAAIGAAHLVGGAACRPRESPSICRSTRTRRSGTHPGPRRPAQS